MVITEFTDSVVPEALAFRIYQDMRGVQGTFRITAATTTAVSQAVSATDDIIYVDNASALSEPDMPNGIFGIITIGGERIMYRVRDLAQNFVSSLLRGTAGSGAAEHATATPVYDIGRGNLLLPEYQDYVESDTLIGDGSSTIFYATTVSIDTTNEDSTFDVRSLEVYVGGTRQYAYSDTTVAIEPGQYRWNIAEFTPLAIEFVVQDQYPELAAPPLDIQITILVRKGVTWYAPGVGTASDGIALQETNTAAARFLRGR